MRVKAGVRLSLVAMVATAGLVGFTSGPASALCGPPSGPPAADGRIREIPGGSFVGNNIYSFGQEQIAFSPTIAGAKYTYEVKFKNRGDTTRGIFVQARVISIAEAHNFRARAFVGGTEITSVIFAGSDYKFAGVQPGTSTPTLTVTVKVKNSAPSDAGFEVRLHGAYGNLDIFCGDAPAIAVDEVE
jgi:hypothetical protein